MCIVPCEYKSRFVRLHCSKGEYSLPAMALKFAFFERSALEFISLYRHQSAHTIDDDGCM